MKIIKNEKLISRNGKIGEYTTLGGLISMAIGLYLSVTSFIAGIKNPETITTQSQLVFIGLMVVGLILSQISGYFSVRYGKSPRPDEKIDAGLKGLHSEFNLYHYTTPASHVLVGPAGVWVILPYHQGGKVEFSNNRWRLSGGGFLQGYMRIFGQEGLGRPDMEASVDVSALTKFFQKKMDDADIPEVKPVLVFTNDNVELDASDSPIPAMKLKQLKEFVREKSKTRVLNSDQIEKIISLLL